jgi:transcription elongation factor SPT6
MMATAERQMVTVTNQVGVDLSQLHSQEWRQATLPYVAGLGPRKARALLRTLAASDAPTTRKALKETLGEVSARRS